MIATLLCGASTLSRFLVGLRKSKWASSITVRLPPLCLSTPARSPAGEKYWKATKEKKRKENMLVWKIFATISTGRLFPGLQAYFCSKYWKFNWKHLKIFQIKFKILEILKIKFVSSLHIFLSLKYICFLQQLVDQPWLMIFETVGERCRIPIIGDYPRFRGNLSQGILPSSSLPWKDLVG